MFSKVESKSLKDSYDILSLMKTDEIFKNMSLNAELNELHFLNYWLE